MPKITKVELFQLTGITNAKIIKMQSAKNIGDEVFAYHLRLETLELPNAEIIGNKAFYDCRIIKSITLPNVITIGNEAFGSCSALTQLMLPKTMAIGKNSLKGCDSLTEIYLTTPDKLIEDVNSFYQFQTKNCTLYLNINKKPDVINGNEWAEWSWKEIKFVN